MQLIAKGTASSAANPVLVFYGISSSWLADVYSLEFQIWSPTTQVFPSLSGTRQAVDLTNDRLGLGRYAAAWSVPSDEPLGAHEVRWFYRLTSSSPEQTARACFEVVSALTAAGPFYAAPSDLAGEGIATGLSEARQLHALSIAGALLEQFTRTFFEPRYLAMTVDGAGGSILHLLHAVSCLEAVTMDGNSIEAATLAVYNRHLSGLTAPDDRKNPKVVRQRCALWSRGVQNIVLSGVFGSLVRGAPWGDPHPLAKHVTKLLAARELATLGSEDREEAQTRYRILSESTRDQSYTKGPLVGAGMVGPAWFTGDPEIDQLIMMLRGPIRAGAL